MKLLLHYKSIEIKIKSQMQELKMFSAFKNNETEMNRHIECVFQIHSYNLKQNESLSCHVRQVVNENNGKYKNDIILALEIINKIGNHKIRQFDNLDNIHYSDINTVLISIYANLYYIRVIEAIMYNCFENILWAAKAIVEQNAFTPEIISYISNIEFF